METEKTVHDREALEYHRNYCARKELYGMFGYDIEKERRFIIEKAVPLYGNILEVGTGKGHFAAELARRGYSFTSVDENRENLHTARLHLKYFGFENCVVARENAEKLSFKDGSFRVVFMVNVLHHLEHPYAVLSELIRVVSPDGKLVISDFTDEGFAVMDRIHANEGTSHDKGKVSMNCIGHHFAGKGFRIEKFKSRFQEVFVVQFGSKIAVDLFA